MPTNGILRDYLNRIEVEVGRFSSYIFTLPNDQRKEQRQISVYETPTSLFLAQQGTISRASYINQLLEWTTSSKLLPKYVEQQRNARIYLNTDIFPRKEYDNLRRQIDLRAKGLDYSKASGVCIASSVDLLVSHEMYYGEAHSKPIDMEGGVPETLTTLTILSAPTIDLTTLSSKLRQDFASLIPLVTGMYFNIFNAAIAENKSHIALPAAGLGVFLDRVTDNGESSPPYVKLHFDALLTAAKAFPQLNVICNAGKYQKEFKERLEKPDSPPNVAQASKDITFIAAELVRCGIPCAINNPSDSAAVLGERGLGWAAPVLSDCYADEEYLGATTTLPLHGRGLNPDLYNDPNRVIEFAGKSVLTSSAVGANRMNSAFNLNAFHPGVCHPFNYEQLNALMNTYEKESTPPLKMTTKHRFLNNLRYSSATLHGYIESHPQSFIEVLKGFFSHRMKDALKECFGESVMAIAELYAKECVEFEKNTNDITKTTKLGFLKNVLAKLVEKGKLEADNDVKKIITLAYLELNPTERAQVFKATFSSRIERLIVRLIGKNELDNLKSQEADESLVSTPRSSQL